MSTTEFTASPSDLRALAEQSNAWPFEQAKAILTRLKKKPKHEVLFETGYGPSGLPHIGTFGEVARTTMVRHAFRILTEDKIKTRLIAFSDDMDGLRKVPDNVPNKEMLSLYVEEEDDDEMITRNPTPLTSTPDPFGTHESFGAHNNARLRVFLDQFGFDYEFKSATETYRSGAFDATLVRYLERYRKVKEIMDTSLRERRRRTYSPFLPIVSRYDEGLGKERLQVLHHLRLVEARPEKGSAIFQELTTSAEPIGKPFEHLIIGGGCKLQWKPDWAMRWIALGIDYEMAGKDLIDSVKLSGKICTALGGMPPEGFNYELFLDEQGQKISKSKGNGLTIDEWLRYASPESLSYFMYREPKAAKRLHFDVIPRTVDEYQQSLDGYQRQDGNQRLSNPVWHIHAGNPPVVDMPVTFQLLLTLVSSSNAENAATLWGFIGRYRPGVTAKTHPKLDALVGYAINYYRDFVAPTKKFREPTDIERVALQDLRDALSQLSADSSAEAIQNVVYEIGRREPFLDEKKAKDGKPGVSLDWFNMLYQVLLGQEKGPRFGSFVAVYGLPNAVAMIDGALARSSVDTSPKEEHDQIGPSFWLSATPDDVKESDFEAPIEEISKADCHELSERFRTAIPLDEKTGKPDDSPAARVFSMLNAITGMLFQPSQRNEPFGAMVVFADGRRSPIPEDFRGGAIETLALLAERATTPVLRARLADVCWVLDRKRGTLGSLAISSYVEIVQKIDGGELELPFEEKSSALDHECRDYLRRALQIGRSIGWDKAEVVAARDWVIKLRKRARDQRTAIPMGWFSKLDLDFGVSDATEVATNVEEVLGALRSTLDLNTAADLWRLAARAYHVAKKKDESHRCQAEAAECLVMQSETTFAKQGSAMLASHQLSEAIAQLHGIPGKRNRRTELRHRLIDMQAGISEEMSAFSHPMDIREIVEKVEKGVEGLGVLERLFVFADVVRSPNPDDLVKDAVKTIEEHPLSSLFGAAHLDREGKVIHRTKGGGLGDGKNDSAISRQIAQDESIRRNLTVSAYIDVIRRGINENYYLSEDDFASLLQHSPFVSHDLVATFTRGFLHFFRGDFVSALYILTPLLENSLRHVLKAHGHDVTIFDDATQTQQDRTISQLFEQMRSELETIFSPAIVTDLEGTFLIQPGPSLRHSLAHGLLHDGTPYGADAIYGCALIIRLCLVPLFAYREQLLASNDFLARSV